MTKSSNKGLGYKIDQFIFNHSILNHLKYILLNPIGYTVISAINLWFISERLPQGVGGLLPLTFLYVWSIVGAVIYFLDKYKLIIFLNNQDDIVWRRDWKIYFYIIVGFVGIIIGAVLITLESLSYILDLLFITLNGLFDLNLPTE